MLSILRSAAFRRVVAVAAAFCLAIILLFMFVYWQTDMVETNRLDSISEAQSVDIANASAEERLWMVQTGNGTNLHRIAVSALFDLGGKRIAGGLTELPAELPLDGKSHTVEVLLSGYNGPHWEWVSLVGRKLPNGEILVIGRNAVQLQELRSSVMTALELGMLPALLLAVGFGILLGHRTNQRIRTAQAILEQVRQGSLSERLPVRSGSYDFDRLACSVNHMLGEVERLMGELQHVGNNIAHDLRTPLSRVRAMLERAHRPDSTREEMALAIDRAVLGLDQASGIITALLRIAAIEHRQGTAVMALVDLATVAQEAAELYGPIAEAKRIDLTLAISATPEVPGDHDLLFEALANLLDNAIKFTPEDGRVRLSVRQAAEGPVVEVADTGPGIPPERREQVFARFNQLDKSRRVPGAGLGLSLVLAIARMHGFAVAVDDDRGVGCVVRLHCHPTDMPAAALAA